MVSWPNGFLAEWFLAECFPGRVRLLTAFQSRAGSPTVRQHEPSDLFADNERVVFHYQVAGIRYVDSARHSLEVEHFGYRRRLRKLIARFARSNRRHHRSRDASAMKRP
jgi:hypothetical protein